MRPFWNLLIKGFHLMVLWGFKYEFEKMAWHPYWLSLLNRGGHGGVYTLQAKSIIKHESYLLFTVPKSELFCPYLFIYLFIFLQYFCLGLFSLAFFICCINRSHYYFLDEESSGLVTCSRWWAMGYSRMRKTQILTEQVTW